jgi:hypothetical protein
VICYFSAGSCEDWRPDAGRVPGVGAWAAARRLAGRAVARRPRRGRAKRPGGDRLDLAACRGCDAVEPDNVDGYTNNTGFPLARADQLD